MNFEKSKNSNELPKSKESNNCIKYFTIPGVFVFITLIILLNVDYSTNQMSEVDNSKKATAVQLLDDAKAFKPFALDINESPLASDINCEKSTDPCIFDCEIPSNDFINILVKKLEDQNSNCKAGISLTLRGAPFSADETFGETDLVGNFELIELKFDNCNKFSKIEDHAFDKPSLYNLETLSIIQSDGNYIETMNAYTFRGLYNLKHFQMKNTHGPKKLAAEAVFTSFSENLEYLSFVQDSVKDMNGYDPGSWFKNAVYTKLKIVELNNNYFPGTLNEKAFENMEVIEILELASCSIEAISDNAFETITDTLRYLDLSNNMLVTLGTILVKRFSIIFYVFLSENHWDCSCENAEFVEFFKTVEIYEQTLICATPENTVNQPIKSVELCCHEQCEIEEDNDITTSTTISTTIVVTTSEAISTESTQPTTIADYETTSTENVHQIVLYCKLPSSIIAKESYELTLNEQFTYFQIISVSATSVLITFQKQPIGYNLFYFTPLKNESRQEQKINDMDINLTDLYSKHTYIFCLKATNAELATPFNCRSHHMMQQYIGWLSLKHLPIFLAISIATSTFCFMIGILSICCILRCRRKMVNKNEALDKVESELQPVGLCKSSTNITNKPAHCAFKEFSTPQRADRLTSNSYVQYFNNAEMPPPLEITPHEETAENQFRNLRLNLYLETIAEDYDDEQEIE